MLRLVKRLLHKEKSDLKTFYNYSMKYTLLIAVLASFLVAVTSSDLVQLFYGPGYTLAPSFLTIYILTLSYSAFNMVLGNLFNGTGEVRVYIKTVLLKFLASLPLALLLTSHFKVFGLTASIAISDVASLAYACRQARSKYAVSMGAESSLKRVMFKETRLSFIVERALHFYEHFISSLKILK